MVERGKGEHLPFDVAMEQTPLWTHALSAAVIAGAGLVAARLVPEIATAILLAASAIARRFGSVTVHVEVDDRALAVGEADFAREAIDDVWLDPDQSEARVAVATKQRAFVFYFANREQAERFAGALAIDRAPMVGYRPRPVDALASLRFIALAIALLIAGSWIGWAALALALPGLAAFVRAKQISAGDAGVEIGTWRGVTSIPYDAIERVTHDRLVTRDGRTITFGRAELRDALLASPPWLERARAHVVERLEARLAARVPPSPTG